MTDPTNWQDMVKGNRVFILGAGFSAAAGIPMTGELLRRTMEKFSVECDGIHSRVTDYVKSAFQLDSAPNWHALSFSEICTLLHYVELREHGGMERWSSSGSRELLALRFYIAKTIAELTPAGAGIPPLYRQFAEQLHSRDIVIVFNWDCLLETSLEAIGKPWSYDFTSDPDDETITVWKMHGSVNWRANNPEADKDLRLLKGGVRLDWHPLDGFDDQLDPGVIHYCRELVSFEPHWSEAQPLMGEVQPFLVLPGFGKAVSVQAISPRWYKPGFAFACTHDIYIIGLGLARDDFIIQSLFRLNLPNVESRSGVAGRKIRIINPDPAVKRNYDFLDGLQHVEFICEKFSSKHVSLMTRSQ